MRLTRKLADDRAARNTARMALNNRLEQVRVDLDARGIGGRIADKVAADATDAAIEVADVARSNKPVIAGTLVALVAWTFRHRVAALFGYAEVD